DPDTGLAAHLASQGLRAKLYPSLEAAYADTAPDALFVCTPTHTHLAVVRAALVRPVHLFVEKPVATTLADAEAILAAATAAGVVLPEGPRRRGRGRQHGLPPPLHPRLVLRADPPRRCEHPLARERRRGLGPGPAHVRERCHRAPRHLLEHARDADARLRAHRGRPPGHPRPRARPHPPPSPRPRRGVRGGVERDPRKRAPCRHRLRREPAHRRRGILPPAHDLRPGLP